MGHLITAADGEVSAHLRLERGHESHRAGAGRLIHRSSYKENFVPTKERRFRDSLKADHNTLRVRKEIHPTERRTSRLSVSRPATPHWPHDIPASLAG